MEFVFVFKRADGRCLRQIIRRSAIAAQGQGKAPQAGVDRWQTFADGGVFWPEEKKFRIISFRRVLDWLRTMLN